MKNKRLVRFSGLILLSAFILTTFMFTLANSQSKSDGKIAFIRNDDVWLMNADGTGQRPWVAGIANAKGRLSWSPDGKKLAFARQGKVDIKYPAGGGGYHYLYDLFYAYTDSIGSTDNFYMGFTNNLGSQSPDWAANGDLICFIFDYMANKVDATMMDYAVGLYNTETQESHYLEMPEDTLDFMPLMPCISPDGSKVCFVLAVLDNMQLKKKGLVITPSDEIAMTSGELLEMAKKTGEASSPAWSPDGKKIAFLRTDGVYVCDNKLENTRLVTKPEEGLWLTGNPTWSPDSKKLAFSTSNGSIYTVNLDGSGMKRISGPGSDKNPAWSH